MEFWRRGQAATLKIEGQSTLECTGQIVSSAWDEARLLGVDYRATGHDPEWALDIVNESSMRFMIAGSGPVHRSVPQPTGDAKRMVYRTDTATVDLEVIVEEKPCRDRSGGDLLPHTVTVTYREISYVGCGRPVGPA
jgi:uncharacterized membrane protein